MNESASRQTVTALFDHPSAAQDAATALASAGYGSEQVTVQPFASDEVLKAERNQDPDLVYRGVIPADRGGALGFVIGFLGGFGLGLLLGTGSVNVMGIEPAVNAGPFLSALIGALVLGVAGAFMGYTFNAPLNRPEPPVGDPPRLASPTVVSVKATPESAEEVVEVLKGANPSRLSSWRADNGEWAPTALA